MMTFKEYVGSLRAGYDAKGDFVRLACANNDLPQLGSWYEMRAYLNVTGDGTYPILEAGEGVWRDYQKAVAKERA